MSKWEYALTAECSRNTRNTQILSTSGHLGQFTRVLIHLGCRRELLAILTLAADTVACFENGAMIERAPVHNFQGRESDHRIPEKMGKTLGD